VAGAFVHEAHLGGNFRFSPAGGDTTRSERFKMERTFKPMPTAEAWQVSNAPVFSMAVAPRGAGAVRPGGHREFACKSEQLTGYLAFIIAEVAKETGTRNLEVITPK
jgi:kynureninase